MGNLPLPPMMLTAACALSSCDPTLDLSLSTSRLDRDEDESPFPVGVAPDLVTNGKSWSKVDYSWSHLVTPDHNHGHLPVPDAPDVHPGGGARGVAAPGARQQGAAQGPTELLEALEVPLVVHPHLD